ncbi:MAG: NTP transferase domain-containing protein [Ardenticatenaceae bacterium]|nr:NTP transferase domain-containing protein [Ardenticatenaceae bacterium]
MNGDRALKVIILAAGLGTRAGVSFPKVLLPLGEQKIIDYVIKNACRFAAAEDIYVVIGPEGQQVQAHLGGGYHYILQPQPLGTGDAVRCTAPFLQDFAGDLLILYGDTPLFRPSPLRGLVSRHYLKGAALTLFTAVLPTPFPYGQIIRNDGGEIVDIVEEGEQGEATAVQPSYEYNIGAYIVQAAALYPALAQLTRHNLKGEYLLTDCVRLLVQSGLRVANYQSYAEEDALGINTPEDLQEAEFTLQKRLFRPRQVEAENLIHFGTGGWRAIIGEGFTMVNVRRLCQALANGVVRGNREGQGVVIGYDRRFLSDRAAETAAEVFAGNNIPVFLVPEDVPTPLITYMTADLQAALGLIFTASHNPPEWNGLKVFHSDGSLLQTAETNQIEAEANGLTADDVVRIGLDVAQAAGVVRLVDYTNQYVDAVESLIDLAAIRRAGLRIAIDPMFGVGQVTLGIILTEARCRLTTIHEHRNPLFGGRSPAPDVASLRQLMTTVRDGRFDLGLAMDGDADRIAIVDEQGGYVHINDILLLLYHYLVTVKGEAGGVVRNLATTHMLDRLAAHLGQPAYEVPVGFKHITAAMQAHHALLGGESSGGLTIRGHIQGKDGIFASALVVEMLARTGKRISELLTDVYAITGQLITVEEAVPATAEMKVVVPRKLRETAVADIAGYPVVHTSFLDGTKFLLENDNWLLLRFSGTEPVLRIFAEADSMEKAEACIAWGKAQLQV